MRVSLLAELREMLYAQDRGGGAPHLPGHRRGGKGRRHQAEETLVVRVHREFLEKQRLPSELVTKDIWEQRLQDIRTFERYL
jgi:hypothetical protein